MQIENVFWFTQMGHQSTLGIVIGKDRITGEAKAFIGTADGIDEQLDAQSIVKYGGKLDGRTAKAIADSLNK